MYMSKESERRNKSTMNEGRLLISLGNWQGARLVTLKESCQGIEVGIVWLMQSLDCQLSVADTG